MPPFSGRPVSSTDRTGEARSEAPGEPTPLPEHGRSGPPPYATMLLASQVRFVRTPDRVLRERRGKCGPAPGAESAAAGPAVAASFAQSPPAGGEGAARTLRGAWALPTWLAPFAPSPNLRFTRTPETIIRRQELPHPRRPGSKTGAGVGRGATPAIAASVPPEGREATSPDSGSAAAAPEVRRSEGEIGPAMERATEIPGIHRLPGIIQVGLATGFAPPLDQDNAPDVFAAFPAEETDLEE